MTSRVLRLTVVPERDEDVAAATALARELDLECAAPGDRPDAPLVLEVSTRGLALAFSGKQAPRPVSVDFAEPTIRRRMRRGGREALVRALRGKRTGALAVFDATAGFGVDAFVAASRGLRVTMCERQPILVALLRDGLERAVLLPGYAPILERLRLVVGDSRRAIAEHAERSALDAVYLDPMFPKTHGKNSALPARSMQALRQLLGADESLDEGLLDTARSHSPRVVVKRPRKAQPLDDQEPTRSVVERSCRYDVYLQ